MISSELITPQHLARKAIIYIRQSSPQQILSHQESLRLQYALRERAIAFGWRPDDILIIDTDLGLSATSAEHRAGFKEVLAQVTLGQVGMLLSYDVTRLARNCSDWYPLLDLCGYKGCLIADRDGVYDPSSTNGRLLLGLKGQLSELELHTLRARMTAGLIQKAQRGALALPLPIGLERDMLGRVVLTADAEVRDRLHLVFATFLEQRSASKLLAFLTAHKLQLPRRDRFGDVVWKPPTLGMLVAILKNPAYAGAFVYGRTRTVPSKRAPSRTTAQRLPMNQWQIRINDIYPAYIAWTTFEQIQGILQDNYAAYQHKQTKGIPRGGAALLTGLVYCGVCGHAMMIRYKGAARYVCNYLRRKYHAPLCQELPITAIDQAVVRAFFAALSPIELDVYAQAVATWQTQQAHLALAHHQHLQRLRYDADLAQRQFQRVDSDNRLVAAELERRWEAALRALQQAEAASPESPPSRCALPESLQEQFRAIGRHLPTLWPTGQIAQPHKKALLRCLIEKVILQRLARDYVQVRIVWKGGETTRLEVPHTVGTFTDLTGAQAMEDLILVQSAQGLTDAEIAANLTAQGYRSPSRPMVLASTVATIRLKHRHLRTPSQSHPRRIAGYLTVSQLAHTLALQPHWIYDRIHKGSIQIVKHARHGIFLFPDTPSTLASIQALKAGNCTEVAFGTMTTHLD